MEFEHIGMGCFKSNMVTGNIYDESLARLDIIESEDKYWKKLVNTDCDRSILFQCNYDNSRFDNINIPFGVLKSKN